MRGLFLLCATAFVTACAATSATGDGPSNDALGAASEPIVGGYADDVRTYVVGVGNQYNGSFCSGTVISKHTVITAAHCFHPDAGPDDAISRVFFGRNIALRLSSVAVAQVIPHPNYTGGDRPDNDLAVLELLDEAPTQPAPLLRETMDNTADYIGPDFAFAGYGNDVGNGSYAPGNYFVRRVAMFPIHDVGPADVGFISGPITANQFYYAQPGQNTCDGDSGGPALFTRNGVEYLAGATSYGDADCVQNGVDTRTDLPMITGFIQAYIDQFEALDPCRPDGVCDELCNQGADLVDVDCAENHCGADGICGRSCVNPPDPDCPDAGADPAGGGGGSTGAGAAGGYGGFGGGSSGSTTTTPRAAEHGSCAFSANAAGADGLTLLGVLAGLSILVGRRRRSV